MQNICCLWYKARTPFCGKKVEEISPILRQVLDSVASNFYLEKKIPFSHTILIFTIKYWKCTHIGNCFY